MRLAAFLGVSAAVICTPGPDTALTIRNALAGGRRGGVATAAGVALGQAVWTLAASVGVTGVLHVSEAAFVALRTAGPVYFAYLGTQALRAALGGSSGSAHDGIFAPRITPSSALRQGLISNLSNPKMAAFFTSLLPQFSPGAQGAFPALLLLGLLFCVLTLAWLTVYSLATAQARGLLTRPGVRRALEGLAGAALIGLGLRLALGMRGGTQSRRHSPTPSWSTSSPTGQQELLSSPLVLAVAGCVGICGRRARPAYSQSPAAAGHAGDNPQRMRGPAPPPRPLQARDHPLDGEAGLGLPRKRVLLG